ncbi:hypothetical protein BJV74DRAFT_264301 [Russula compacta]|nr:hypothetical protein BJV74DRAFT_264301 [Russula compacta]
MLIPDAAQASAPNSLALPGMALGKGHHGVDNADVDGGTETSSADGLPPRKKGKGKVGATIWVSEAGGSPNRTHQRPATGTLARFDNKRGQNAERRDSWFQLRKEFVINSCRDQVSSRSRGERVRREGHIGSRGVGRERRGTTQTAWCSSSRSTA